MWSSIRILSLNKYQACSHFCSYIIKLRCWFSWLPLPWDIEGRQIMPVLSVSSTLQYNDGRSIPKHTLKIIYDLNAAFCLLLSKIVSFKCTKIEPATSLDSIQSDIRIFMHIRKTVVGAAPFWDKTWIFSYQICPHVLFTAYINSPLF